MLKSFKTRVIPMGNEHWSCIRITFSVEQEFGSKARVTGAKRGLSLRRALCDSQGLSPALPARPSSRMAKAATL